MREPQRIDEAQLLNFIYKEIGPGPPDTPWRALLLYLETRYRADPKLNQDARLVAIVKQLCKLLSAADTRLAAAAASAIASGYTPETGRIDGLYYPVLKAHVRDIGATLGNTAVVGQMVATGPPLAAGCLTVAAAAGSEMRTDAKSAAATAAALLPGLLPALVLACKVQPRECSAGHAVCILVCATLALAAAQLRPPEGSAASKRLSNPRLLEQTLCLAEAALSCMDAALDDAAFPAESELAHEGRFQVAGFLAESASDTMGAVHHLLLGRQLSLTAAQADRVLAIFARALQRLIDSVKSVDPWEDEHSRAALPGMCQMLWLCSGAVLPAAIRKSSAASIQAVVKASIEVLEHAAQGPAHVYGSCRSLLLVAARVVRTVSTQMTMLTDAKQASVPNQLLQVKVLPQLHAPDPAWQVRNGLVFLPPAWPPHHSKHNVVRDLDVTVLLADELAANLAAVVLPAFQAQQPSDPDFPSGACLEALIACVKDQVVEPFAAYMIGDLTKPHRPRRVHINKGIRLPGEPYPGCPLAAERAVAAAILQLAEACAAAQALSQEQLRQRLRAHANAARVARTLVEQMPGHAARVGGMLLRHLGRELEQLDATGDAAPVDALWPRLLALLLALAGGHGMHGTPLQELDVVDGLFMAAQVMMAQAAAARRGDIVIGLCEVLQRLLQRRPLAAELLHSPDGWPSWPSTWRKTDRRVRATANRQLLAEVEPAIARVAAALQRALGEMEPRHAEPQPPQQPRAPPQQQPQHQQPASDSDAAAAAAERMAQLLLQEEDAGKQQQAAKAARRKKRKQTSATGASAPAAAALAVSATDTNVSAAPQLEGTGGLAASAPAEPEDAARQPSGTAAAADHRAADAHAWRLCPLTKVVMSPVLLPADGHSYERAAIVEWLQQHSTSPLTGQPADTETLTPNHALRNLLQAFATRLIAHDCC